MSLIVRNSANRRIENEMDRVWRQWFAPFEAAGAPVLVSPSTDLAETENEVIVKVELPGLTDKDIHVTLAEDTLTIKGEKKQEKEEKGTHYHHVERRFGSFRRCVRLPAPVNGNGVKAKFENGVLEITLPKAEEAKPRKIEVN